jgi:phosphatidate cytidylyltransferase
MLKWRLLLGTLIIAVILGLCVLDARMDRPGMEAGLPGVALMPVVLLLTVLATQEVLRLAQAAGIRPVAWTVYAGNLLLVVAQWLPALYLYMAAHRKFIGQFLREWLPPLYAYLAHHSWRELGYFDFFLAGTSSPLWAMALGMLAIFYGEMRRYEQPAGTFAKIAVGIFCLVYIGLMVTFAIQMRLFWGVGALAAWIITVKMGDIGAYTVGRLFGRNKMSPTISPGKTVEGAVGAVLFALVGSWISFHVIVPLAPPYAELMPGRPMGWFVFGLLMGSVGMLGDLAESLLKRDVGCKDSSAWMPGFGGVLDILDSLLLTAPVAWLCWSLGIVGAGVFQ